MSTDPGLRFWLRYVDGQGGLTDPSPGGTLVVLPEVIATAHDLPEELIVTADPDVARDDGVVLLATGHPVLTRAADATLAAGDSGVITLEAPDGPAPGQAWLEERLRDQVPVHHGRIDVTGQPVRTVRPLLRVGALVTYSVSDEENYQERLECWVDAITGLELNGDAVRRVQRCPRATRPGPPPQRLLEPVRRALADAHRLLDTAAERRRSALSTQAADAHRRERTRARDYYADALRSLERRQAGASAERAPLLAARAAATRDERTRRMHEIDEKYRARHGIRPFRLHLVQAPGWQVPVDVRRGPRRYPTRFDWLHSARTQRPAARTADPLHRCRRAKPVWAASAACPDLRRSRAHVQLVGDQGQARATAKTRRNGNQVLPSGRAG